MPLLIAAWAVIALAFALHRIPYDDEWFSLTLARDTTQDAFWRSLANDIHPPYTALVDRATIAITHDFWGISVVHVLATAAAISLLASSTSRLGVRAWAVPIGALHPIVLMYGGAARWYPFAFLADALRLWALSRWREDDGDATRDRVTSRAFVVGCALGVMSGYAECVLVAIDALAMIATSPKRARAIALAGVAAIVPVASLVVWKPFFTHIAASAAAGGAALGVRGIAMFLGLGVLGEAHLPPPWTSLAVVALPGLAIVVASTRARPFVVVLARSTLGWCLCAPLGLWHPRYALILWAGLGALVVDAVAEAFETRDRRKFACLPLASASYLALGAALTLGERSFLKGDLNRLPREACEPVYADHPDTVVAPYARIARTLDALCGAPTPALTAGWIRHFDPGDDALFASISSAVAHARRLTYVTVPTGGSSLEETQTRARALIAARCHAVAQLDAVEDRYASLKPWARPSAGEKAYRLRIERFTCP